jgi:hypothetical protein
VKGISKVQRDGIKADVVHGALTAVHWVADLYQAVNGVRLPASTFSRSHAPILFYSTKKEPRDWGIENKREADVVHGALTEIHCTALRNVKQSTGFDSLRPHFPALMNQFFLIRQKGTKVLGCRA